MAACFAILALGCQLCVEAGRVEDSVPGEVFGDGASLLEYQLAALDAAKTLHATKMHDAQKVDALHAATVALETQGKALTDAMVDVKDEADAEAKNNTTGGVEESETENVKKADPRQNYDWHITARDSNCQPAKADKIDKFGRVRNLIACQGKTLANKNCGSTIWFQNTKGRKTNKCGCMKSGKEGRCNTQKAPGSKVYERTNKAEYSDDSDDSSVSWSVSGASHSQRSSVSGSASGPSPSQHRHTGRASLQANRAYQSKKAEDEFPYDEYGPNGTVDEFPDDESQGGRAYLDERSDPRRGDYSSYRSENTRGSPGNTRIRGNNKRSRARSSHDMDGVNATFTTDGCARGCKPLCRFRGGYDANHCKCVMLGRDCGECHESCGVACEMTEAAMQCEIKKV